MKEMKVLNSIYHLSMKFITPKGIRCVKGTQYASRDCYNKASRQHRMEMSVVQKTWKLKGKAQRREKGSINMISIEELPEGYFESIGDPSRKDR